MGVYINGIKVPAIVKVHYLNGRRYVEDPQSGEWREMVEIPPHGNLMDRDAYRDEFMSGVYDLCDDDPDNCRANAIIDLFDSAPTVIPAEPPKEDT